MGVKTSPPGSIPPMQNTEKSGIEHNGRRIEYTIIRSARRKKTVEISLDPQVGVIVRSPARTPQGDLADFVRSRAGWILGRATEDVLSPAPRRYTDGESLYYLGEQVPIFTTATHDRRVSVNLKDGAFHIAIPDAIADEERPEKSRAALERWYRKQASLLLTEKVWYWQSDVGRKKPSKILVRSQRRRWGSCSSDGSIRLNWRLIMADHDIIDYVVVHELAHLTVMDHSPRFWKRVEDTLPNYRALRRRLNKVGLHLWL